MKELRHIVTYEPQPIADQWLARCICGWAAPVSSNDFPTRDAALQEAERLGREHLHSTGEPGQEFRR